MPRCTANELGFGRPPPDLGRPPARYLWALRLARIYEAFPLICPICGGERRIIAFITEAVDVRAILEHLDEPATPPRIASAGTAGRVRRRRGGGHRRRGVPLGRAPRPAGAGVGV